MDRITITQLTSADASTLAQINSLLHQLSGSLLPLELQQLEAVIAAEGNTVYVATDEATGNIIGTTTLITVHQFAGTKCWIEDVVVSGDYRGKGVGKLLIKAAIAGAPINAGSINLTSNPSRTSARHLYESLGFEIRDTTVFRLAPERTSNE